MILSCQYPAITQKFTSRLWGVLANLQPFRDSADGPGGIVGVGTEGNAASKSESRRVMPTVSLSAQFVRQAECVPGRKKVDYFDGSQRGFLLEVRASGGKT